MICELPRPSHPVRMATVRFNEITNKRAIPDGKNESDGKIGEGNPCALSRREMLFGMAALSASAAIPALSFTAQTGSSTAPHPFRIDTHHHFSIPKLIAESTAKG